MSKKRTRSDKEKAVHQFAVSWSPREVSLKTAPDALDVNSQLTKAHVEAKQKINNKDLATFSDKNLGLASVKKDIVKSLILVAFILASEVMIYLNWTTILSIRFGF